MALPPVGLATFTAAKQAEPPEELVEVAEAVKEAAARTAPSQAKTKRVQSDTYALAFDAASGVLQSITNLKSGATTSLAITWGWYNSSVGGCTNLSGVKNQDTACDGQKSGAYIFRPNSSTAVYPGPERTPTIEVRARASELGPISAPDLAPDLPLVSAGDRGRPGDGGPPDLL